MKTLTTLALFGLAFAAFARVSKVHHGRTHGRPAAEPAEVQTWEGEGGGLPTGGPGAGVRVSTPATDPDPTRGGLGFVN